jgi:hypothetical protein
MFLVSGKPVNKGELLLLAQSVYSPFVAHISKYAQYQQTYLLQQQTALECSKTDMIDTVQSLGQSIPRAISIAVEANKTCLSFTEGCGYCGLMKALKVSMNRVHDIFIYRYNGNISDLYFGDTCFEYWLE